MLNCVTVWNADASADLSLVTNLKIEVEQKKSEMLCGLFYHNKNYKQ